MNITQCVPEKTAVLTKFINGKRGMTEVSYVDSYKTAGGKSRFLEIL